jgi:hypothetical protein
MMHVTYSDKTLLIGDEATNLMMEYTAALVNASKADTVDINAWSDDGQEVVATFLLQTGAPVMAETVHTSMNEPDNWEAVAYMREHLAKLQHERPPVQQESTADVHQVDEMDL